MPPTQYDSLSKTYPAANKVPAQAIIAPNVRDVLGSVAGLDVLELACGAGEYTRRILSSEWGPAASVFAVDISAAMVNAARAWCADLLPADGSAEKGAKSRLETAVGDCTEPDLLSSLGVPRSRSFDVVLGAWLLNYAADEAAQARMWANVASHLKPGGRFVGVIPNLASPVYTRVGDTAGHAKYGVTSTSLEKVAGGWRHHVTIHSEPLVEFDNCKLNEEGEALYVRAAQQARMRRLERRKVLPPREAVDAQEAGFWDDWYKCPGSEICIAYKD